jgi:hypothetical protein
MGRQFQGRGWIFSLFRWRFPDFTPFVVKHHRIATRTLQEMVFMKFFHL